MKRLVVAALIAGCGGGSSHTHHVPTKVAKAGSRTISIVGTNDLHGQLDRLPLFGGFIKNLREARAADGGGVLLVDAGDLFQGTLESNIAEGADVIKAYNQLGYAASAVGNHEFDYGPEGPQVIAHGDEDPRGALRARASEAKFPFLVTNILDEKSDQRIKWQNMPASTLVDVAGTQVGILGASTESTPFTTMTVNFAGLKMGQPTARYIADEAKALRSRGAQVVVLTMHIGSSCKNNENVDDLSSCDQNEELFKVLSDLPKGLVDVVIAGHTHAAIAKRIDGMAVIESYSSGRAFGRVDLRVTETHVSSVKIMPPMVMCPLDKDNNPAALADCHPEQYEGKTVVADADVQKIVDDALARTADKRTEKLGVTLGGPITKAYKAESQEGNWFTDLMLAAQPTADVAMTNGGGLRADIPAGDLTYERLYSAIPFDNRFALVTLKGKHIRRLVSQNVQRDNGFQSWGGLTVVAKCKAGALDTVIKVKGKMLADEATYTLVTSDFLASGGDGVIGRLKLPDGSIKITDSIMRDGMADVLRKQKGTIDPNKLFGANAKRFELEGGQRPLVCQGPKQQQKVEEPD
ncbi:MAG: 5'-nucleotidase C-terminal domain-containing protein [Kofleriaceae bacterium]